MTDGSAHPGGGSKTPWHQSIPFLVVAILIVGPLAIPLIWINKKIPFLMKLGLSLLVLGLTYYAITLSEKILGQLNRQLQELSGSAKP